MMMAFMNLNTRTPSGGFCHLVGFQAVRADSHPARTAVDVCVNFLQVRHPAPARKIVRMRNVVAADRFLAADVANTCHLLTSM
jgi:hypothetical protein